MIIKTTWWNMVKKSKIWNDYENYLMKHGMQLYPQTWNVTFPDRNIFYPWRKFRGIIITVTSETLKGLKVPKSTLQTSFTDFHFWEKSNSENKVLFGLTELHLESCLRPPNTYDVPASRLSTSIIARWLAPFSIRLNARMRLGQSAIAVT